MLINAHILPVWAVGEERGGEGRGGEGRETSIEPLSLALFLQLVRFCSFTKRVDNTNSVGKQKHLRFDILSYQLLCLSSITSCNETDYY